MSFTEIAITFAVLLFFALFAWINITHKSLKEILIEIKETIQTFKEVKYNGWEPEYKQ